MAVVAPTERDAEGRLDLVRRARAGERAAFDALLGERLDRTYRIARAVLGNDHDASDATQEAWITAWRRMGTLREAERFDAWLDRITINACRLIVRRRGPIREVPIDPSIDPATPAPGPDNLAERDRVERAFARLEPAARAILVLHHLEHQTVPSIADTLGIPEGTVKSRLHAARAVLGRALAEGDDE